jgi:hypothetical protein
MKTATSLPQAKASPATGEERQTFFERAYLALLASALNQFEVRGSDGQLTQLYQHTKLEGLAQREDEHFFEGDRQLHGEERHHTLEKSMRRSDRISQRLIAADETTRIEVLTDRCYRMALAATDRYFEERELSRFNSQC